ncbi:MAG: T9SS type A sorting domain-containing protein, partial [Candidatus Marinimicrobia bacterium]|nr:T9SS type A sorting domain-containing protein [Candidatus Neomarinimicrobiota bacterium]
FNPTTVIRLEYGVGSNTVVNIYNTQGVLVEELVNGYVEAGSHDLTWNASNMPSGVYIVKMHAGEVVQSQKIVLMK